MGILLKLISHARIRPRFRHLDFWWPMPFHIFNRRMINLGNQDPSWCDEVVSVARPSVLGNPFPIGQGPNSTRDAVIARYRLHLWDRFKQEDPAVMAELQRLGEMDAQGKNVALVCWCAPLACHADVIARAAAVAHAKNGKTHARDSIPCAGSNGR